MHRRQASEIILEGQSGRIFPTGDGTTMAVHIAVAIDEPERTKQMSRAGRTLVEKEYSMDSMLDQLNLIYMSHLDHPAG